MDTKKKALPGKDLPPSVSDDEIGQMFKDALKKDREEIDSLPKKFKPGEGIEEVVDDKIFDD